MAHFIRSYKYVRHCILTVVKTHLNDDSALLLRRPMITQCVTAAVLFGMGDVVAQQVVEGKGKQHDVSFSAFYFPSRSLISTSTPERHA